MKSRCTNCSNTFDFIQTEQKIGEVTVNYSECDCGARYLISVTDKKIRANLSKLRSYLKKYQQLKGTTGAVKAWERYQRNVVGVREQMKEAEETYSSTIQEVIDGAE